VKTGCNLVQSSKDVYGQKTGCFTDDDDDDDDDYDSIELSLQNSSQVHSLQTHRNRVSNFSLKGYNAREMCIAGNRKPEIKNVRL
jgi:hypothetical protein